MKNYYYLFWADAIISYRKFHPNEIGWKNRVLFLGSFIFSLLGWTIIVWLKYTGIYILPLLSIDIFPSHILNDFFSYIIEFVIPFIIINYAFIFHKNRYKKIIDRYKTSVKNYAYTYSMVILIIYGVTIIISGFFWDVWKK